MTNPRRTFALPAPSPDEATDRPVAGLDGWKLTARREDATPIQRRAPGRAHVRRAIDSPNGPLPGVPVPDPEVHPPAYTGPMPRPRGRPPAPPKPYRMQQLMLDAPEQTPEAVRAARQIAGHSMRDAARAVCLFDSAGWAAYEGGRRTMDTARWTLYLLSVGLHPTAMLLGPTPGWPLFDEVDAPGAPGAGAPPGTPRA